MQVAASAVQGFTLPTAPAQQRCSVAGCPPPLAEGLYPYALPPSVLGTVPGRLGSLSIPLECMCLTFDVYHDSLVMLVLLTVNVTVVCGDTPPSCTPLSSPSSYYHLTTLGLGLCPQALPDDGSVQF